MRQLWMFALLGGAFCVAIALALVGFVDLRGCTRFGRLVEDRAKLHAFLGAEEEAVLQALGEPSSERLRPIMALDRMLVVAFDETGHVVRVEVTD